MQFYAEIFSTLTWLLTLGVVNFVHSNKTMNKGIRTMYKLMWRTSPAASFA